MQTFLKGVLYVSSCLNAPKAKDIMIYFINFVFHPYYMSNTFQDLGIKLVPVFMEFIFLQRRKIF